ncbi:DUF882 domain-containing protein [Rhodomicrobium sp. R_RK_3]|uniref:YcbK family protein n=2 Tax=Rhodomicrobium TaxID=1068 RepID=UPI00148314F1|nr:DUF882 domain-containing protein [Rhodomicrobium sp. R_RK_3]
MENPSPPSPAAEAAASMPNPKPVERHLRLKHHWTGEEIEVLYRIGDDYQPAAMESISHLLRDWRCNKTIAMDPKLIDRLYALQQAIGDHRTIRVISAYRSEGYNASLLAAGRNVDPNSQHMLGRAADVFVPGLKPDKLREAAAKAGVGGVGYYPFSGPRFVHVDSGPERQWTEMDPAERRKLGIHGRRRGPFKLDCEMKMDQALQDPGVVEQLAALPAGAAVIPVAAVQQAAARAAEATAALPAAADGGPTCEAGQPMTPLALLARDGEPVSAPGGR